MSESERGYGGQAAIERMQRRLDDPTDYMGGVDDMAPVARLVAHYVGDACPGGHRDDPQATTERIESEAVGQ